MKRIDIKAVKKTKENPFLISLIDMLNREKEPIWKKVAYELSKPRRERVEVNVSKLEAYAKNGNTVIVPGKVLGAGMLSKKVLVAAFSFSDGARKSIEAAGGKTMSIDGLLKSNPSGREVMILK